MARERVAKLALGGLLVVLAALGGSRLWPLGSGQTVTGAGASNRSAAGRGGPPTSAVGPPDVHLEALDAERPAPSDADRNLFRFKTRASPPPASSPPVRPPVAGVPEQAPSGPPPLPPISMKFIGFLQRQAGAQKIAILSDGRGVYYGSEGAIIEGRYRILKIGEESIEMAYLDGRGRQAIRLTGQ